MDELRWLDCYTLAVMEENACMGRIGLRRMVFQTRTVPVRLNFVTSPPQDPNDHMAPRPFFSGGRWGEVGGWMSDGNDCKDGPHGAEGGAFLFTFLLTSPVF